MLAAYAKPVPRAAVLTVEAGPPRGTGAAAIHGVAGRSLPTPAHTRTARTEAALWTGQAAVGPNEPSRAEAGTGGRITGAPVETPARLLTAGSKPPRGAPLPAAGAVVASGTRAGPQGGVAGLVLAGTTALLPTALPKGAWRAGLLAAGPREARWTATLPGDVVAGGARRALAALATVLSEPATRAGVLTLRAPPSRGAEAGPRDVVTGGSPPAGTALLAVSPKRAFGTGALTLVPGPAGWAEAAA